MYDDASVIHVDRSTIHAAVVPKTKLSQRIGAALRRLRTERGLTQAEVAEVVALAPETISRIETGQFVPAGDAIVKLADLFAVTTDAILRPGARSPGAVGPAERRLLAAVRGLSDEDVEAVAVALKSVIVTVRRASSRRG